MEIRSRNTNSLQDVVYRTIVNSGVSRTSRNGDVLVFPEPVSIRLSHPQERVNFCPHRDANPFFHLWESLAMLAGVNSVNLMAFFAKNMLNFSDNGVRYNAFYGDRARVKWGDQVSWVIEELMDKPDSRQCVVNLWDPSDWLKSTKDKACNLMLLFSVDAEGKLCMTTFNRSNDAIWGGVTGANVVHLSFFQEYVALALARSIGPWWHVSNNLHVYVDNPKWTDLRNAASVGGGEDDDVYPETTPLFVDRVAFDRDLMSLVETATGCARLGNAMINPTHETEPFLTKTAIPVFNAWVLHKNGYTGDAKNVAGTIEALDWRIACARWLDRRLSKKVSS